MSAHQIMTRSVVTVTPESSIVDAAKAINNSIDECKEALQ